MYFLIKFILKCFIVFDAIVSDIALLISLSNSLFLVYRNTADSYMLSCILQLCQFYLLTILDLTVFGSVFRIFSI